MADIVLTGAVDSNKYGWNFDGVSNYQISLSGSFDGGGVKTLRLRPYDIDTNSEVEVLLNGVSLGFLPTTPNNATGPKISRTIEESDQMPGENTIEFIKRSGSPRWGVTDIQLLEGEEGAVLVLRAQDNPVPDSPGKWLAGEIVTVVEDDHAFGFKEMPIQSIGTQTVDWVNARDPLEIPLYGHVIMASSGTITIGTKGDLDVLIGESLVWQAGDYFINYGVREDTTPGGFYHVRVADRTVQETNIYLEAFNKKLEYSSDQYNAQTDLRRFTTTNIRVSASGNNGFTADGINDAINIWNTNYPDNTVTLVDTDNLTYFQVDGIMPIDLYDEWQENTQSVALADYYARRRWRIIQSGLDAIAANGGTLNGQASDIAPFLRDGLLD